MEKKKFSTEMAYFVGIIVLALGTALMERANFGMSMVVAPAYLVYLKVSEVLPWFTFGMAEYCLQALLLVLISIVMRQFKRMYLFSFVTAVFYGIVLDVWMRLIGLIPFTGIPARLIYYFVGMVACSFGVAMLFHTYIAPGAYELFVKEFSVNYKTDIGKTKTVYDCCSCLVAVILSFCFFGWMKFCGINWGTVVCALVNGSLIGGIGKWLEKKLDFTDAWKFRKFFE